MDLGFGTGKRPVPADGATPGFWIARAVASSPRHRSVPRGLLASDVSGRLCYDLEVIYCLLASALSASRLFPTAIGAPASYGVRAVRAKLPAAAPATTQEGRQETTAYEVAYYCAPCLGLSASWKHRRLVRGHCE